MTINGIDGTSTQMRQIGMDQTADPYSRNIQKQIANAQKQLQELSSNEDMSLEEKMKKRQEIQQQINDLNMQLRQHQIEQRKEKQKARGSSMDDMLDRGRSAESAKAGDKSTGLSHTSMTAMISADSSIKQAKVQGGVATKLEGKARVLESEIKLDQARGDDTQKKEEELADMEQKAQAATSSQISTLADASKTMEEAAKADSKTEKTDDKDAKTAGETVSGSENVNTRSDVSVSKSAATAETTTQQPMAYTSVDIRL